ncbi:MAG: hypothetical protein KAS22_04905 [Candidatus Heimdallarchaeota archaeon]|nr:hypothetical protein [Candidatus Heimdallarchaeota archaeon]
MVNRKTYFNDFAVVMMVIIVGSLIVGAIEGINIGRNVKSYHTYHEEVAPGDYMIFNFKINEGARLYINYYAQNLSIYYDDADVIFSVMRENDFEQWVATNGSEPGILNSTFYFDDSYVRTNNLQVDYDGTYYFIIFNTNPYDVEVLIDIEIIPWGHIIAAGIMAVLLLFGTTGMGIRVGHVTVYNAKQEKRTSGNVSVDTSVTELSTTDRKDGVFCQSCGSPLTPKDTRYCQQCVASV